MTRTTTWAGACAMALCLALGAPAAELADLDSLLTEVAAYKYGQSRKAVAAAERLIPTLAVDAAQRSQVEARLLKLLASKATPEARKFACMQLGLVGSPAAVPPLARLLADDDLSHMARMALARIPGDAAADALRQALGTVKGARLVGMVNTVGERGDRKAVASLGKLAAGSDAVLAEAALGALGKIGGSEALAAATAARAKAPAALRRPAVDACLLCADSLVAEGKQDEAAAVYKQVYEGEKDEALRVAAFRGLLSAGDESAWQLIIKTLTTEDPKMWGAAASFAREIPGTKATEALAAALPKLKPDAQVFLLGALAARGDATAQPAALAAAASDQEAVRRAAIDALGSLGDAQSVPLLAKAAATGKGSDQAAARRSLQSLGGKGVDAAIVGAMNGAEPGLQTELIRALAARRVETATPTLLKAAAGPDDTVRREAIKALGVLATQQSLKDLVALLPQAKSSRERRELQKTLGKVGARGANKEEAARVLAAGFGGANTDVACAIIGALGHVHCDGARASLLTRLKGADAAQSRAAIKAFDDWPSAEPAGDLLRFAQTTKDATLQILALRGFLRMLTLPGAPAADATAQMLKDAMAVAKRPDDKKQVLAALANVVHPVALDLAVGCLSEAALEAEAATAVVRIAKQVRKTDRDKAKAAIEKILEVCEAPAARQAAEAALLVVDTALNIAPQGTATSPDGLEKDGASGGDQAAIDGNPETYWDEADNKKLYRLVVTFKQPERISIISILGYQHHGYSPKDFEILCDGKVVKTITNAQYDESFLAIGIGDVTCKTVELKITGYYGNSPAIRELGIYPPGGNVPKLETPKK